MNMKKLSLQPLGDSCMKGLGKSWFFIGLLMTFCLVACSDDDDEKVAPLFPEKQNIVCNANDTREFTFEANANWSLASSAIWCKFKSNDIEEFVLNGTAGKQTVTLLITDDNMQVGKISVAKLELTMGGQTIVIGEVTRSEVDYKLKIYDKEGNDITETGVLKVGYGSFARFDVEANFRFAATNLPGWVELEGGSLVGAVNQKVQGGLKIIENESREKYPVEASDENVITFSDEEGRAFKTFKVVYEGMTPGQMKLTLPASYPTNWVVSMDGKTFTQKSTGGSTGEVTIQKRMPFTIKTLNDDFELVYMYEWEDWRGNKNISLINANRLWIHCEGENGKINLTVDEYKPNVSWGDPETRTGYVLAFSRAEYESIKDNLEENIVVDGEIAYKYEQRNLLIGFTQKEVKQEEEGGKSFTIKKNGWEDVKPTKTTDPSILEFLKGNYFIDDVYSISASAGEYFSIYPLLSESEWPGDAYAINARDEDVAVNIEVSMDGEGMYLGVTIPDTFEEDLIIVFKGNDMLFKKALVISPAIN